MIWPRDLEDRITVERYGFEGARGSECGTQNAGENISSIAVAETGQPTTHDTATRPVLTARAYIRGCGKVSALQFLWVCLGLLFSTQFAEAQTQILRGRAIFAESQSPLIGALVQVRRPSGEIVTTTITSENGSFATNGLPIGTYGVRILRIGFRAFDAGRITITADGATTLNIAWTAIPIPLATRLVKAERSCNVSADSGSLIANVWEEAGKALLSSIVTEQSEAPEIERVNFVRFVDSTGVIVAQDVTGERVKTFRAYSSWAPESLALHGYYRMQGLSYSLVGPDASTLFSDSFVGSHCYSLVDGTGLRTNEIGLAFTPIKSARKDRVDIAGTFWVDRTTWGLRSVEFVYEGGAFSKNSELLGGRRTGGFVEFGSLSTGQWLVTNWRIARPVLDSGQLVTRRPRQSYLNSNPFFAGVDETGDWSRNHSISSDITGFVVDEKIQMPHIWFHCGLL